MSSIGTGYDLSASTFSPDGRIFQVEYALKAVDGSGTAIGLRGRDGVVLAVDKIISTSMYERGTNKRILTVDSHLGFASSGVYPDARALASQCMEEAHDYYVQYHSKIPARHLADRLAMYMHAYTLYSAVRPFGSSILLSSYEPTETGRGPQLYMIDPSGLCYGYNGCAVGKNKQAAKTEIEKLKLKELGMKELVQNAIKILLQVREESKEKNVEIEVSWVSKDTKGLHELVPKNVVEKATEDAKRQLEDEESDTEGRD